MVLKGRTIASELFVVQSLFTDPALLFRNPLVHMAIKTGILHIRKRIAKAALTWGATPKGTAKYFFQNSVVCPQSGGGEENTSNLAKLFCCCDYWKLNCPQNNHFHLVKTRDEFCTDQSSRGGEILATANLSKHSLTGHISAGAPFIVTREHAVSKPPPTPPRSFNITIIPFHIEGICRN